MPSDYALNYTTAVLAAVVGALGMLIMMAANILLASRRRSSMKDLPIECGIPPAPFAWSQVRIRYYIFALFFLIFDVEAVFLFPWVVVLGEAAKTAPWVFYEMLVFIGVLLFGLLYGWRKGVLRWR